MIVVLLQSISQHLSAQSIMPDSAHEMDLDPVVITGQLIPTETKQTVNTVKVITGKTIEIRGVANLEELLLNESNIRINYDPILGGSIVINGLSGENLKILVNGVPLIGRTNGNINASQIPLNNIQQIEIIEGAQSLIYGSDAAAGVINIITKTTQLEPFTVSTRSLLEYNGFQAMGLNIGQQVGPVLIQGEVGVQSFTPVKTPGKRNQVWLPSKQYNGKLGLIYSGTKGLNLNLTGEWIDNTTTNLDSIHRKVFKPYAFDDYYFTGRKNISAGLNYWLNKKIYLQSTLGYNHFTKTKKSVRYDFNKDSTSLIVGQQDTLFNDGLLARISLASRQLTDRFDFLLGLDNYLETFHGQRLKDTLLTKQNYARINELGVFASMNYYPFSGMSVSGGARLVVNELYGHNVTPSISFNYSPSTSVSIKGSYAAGFRSPALKELYFNFIDNNHHIIGNQGLQPEHSHNFKIEVNYTPWRSNNSKLEITSAGFYNNIFQLIELAEQGLIYTYVNIHHMRTKGIRAGLNFSNRMMALSTSYNYAGYYNNLSNEKGEIPDLLWSGDWTNSLQLFTPDKKITFSVWSKFTGKTPYYFLGEKEEVIFSISENWVNLNTSLQLNLFDHRVALTAGGKNLLDRRTVHIIGEGIGPHGSEERLKNISWGRSYFIQANFKLSK